MRLFINAFTADEKYSLVNRDNLALPIQMQFSQKQKTFYDFFAAVFEIKIKF